ncbi:NmrA-like family protein [Penicillium subrubescens]|uniref:NmrA-like family domain-containing protein n=1 Tax=Penicillium subrubescens TaxID=1316194 RepID=A0A1Q5UBN4_9EURO|nr:NmrA-like family protein [Penicillium subrubescens]KAJ5904767.1 NmrA-like family protein [Penicillium subrubescens]OKP09895.1 NmrA-like family domain-containing protein [Penicillium subrubescens]
MTVSPQIVTVFGTGNQAGAVARALLADKAGRFRVRAISRHPDSKSSKQLVIEGAEIIHADGWNQDELTKAFTGSWAAFVNTNSDDPQFLAPGNGPTEFDLGKNIVDSLIAANVKNLVYSSFSSSMKQTNGKLFIKPQEMKYQALEYAKSCGHFEFHCGIYAAWYYEQFLDLPTAEVGGGFPSIPDDEGYLTLRVPVWGSDENPSFLSIGNDFGDLVHGILLDPGKWNGKSIPAVSDVMTFEQLTNVFQKVTGKKSRYVPLSSWEDFGRGIPEMDDHRLLFAFTQSTGGRYFGDVPTETDTANELKKAAAEAQGKVGSRAGLMPVEEFFKIHFVS